MNLEERIREIMSKMKVSIESFEHESVFTNPAMAVKRDVVSKTIFKLALPSTLQGLIRLNL